eukprot:8153620-Lingulodinium_polyedra.AAC.1
MLAIDSVLLALMGAGLAYFLVPEDDPWRRMTITALKDKLLAETVPPPLLVVSSDQGGGGYQCVFYLAYRGGARLMHLSDPSHRSWNDVKQAFSDAGVWAFVLLMTVVLNLDYGPWDGAQFHQKAA